MLPLCCLLALCEHLLVTERVCDRRPRTHGGEGRTPRPDPVLGVEASVRAPSITDAS